MRWTRLGLRVRPTVPDDDARSFVDQLRAVARAAEGAGYDTLWLPAAAPAGVGSAGVLDPFVVAASLVRVTSSIRLGCLDQPLEARAPAMLAKAVASLDVLSGGRAAVGVDAAGDPDALAEALQIVRSMLTEDGPTVEGSRFHIRAAWNEPRRREATPPVVLHVPPGTEAEQQLAVVAQLVDGVLVPGAPAGAVRPAAGPDVEVIALLDAAGDLRAAAGECLAAGCDAVVVDLAAGADAPARAAAAAGELAPLLGAGGNRVVPG